MKCDSCFVGELKTLRENSNDASIDISYDLSKTKIYALQLERKLRDALNVNDGGFLEKSLSSSSQSLEASIAEIERFRSASIILIIVVSFQSPFKIPRSFSSYPYISSHPYIPVTLQA